jgi:hypothetical protein
MKPMTKSALHRMFNLHEVRMARFSPERDAKRFAARFVKSGATISADTRAVLEAAIAHHEAAAGHLKAASALLTGLCPGMGPASATASVDPLTRRWNAATSHMEP